MIGALSVGFFLIKGVLREIEQREKLQALTLELAQMNEKLQELDRMKSEFISLAGHQLRAPLTVIKGYISLILEGTIEGASDKVREALEKVQFSAEELVKLVSSLLDLSRIESGKIKYEFIPGDFAAIVREVIDKFRKNAEKKQIAVVFENKAGAMQPFAFDPDKMREVVVNLVDNAIKYSGAHTEIRITQERIATPAGEVVHLSVKDSGMGIKPADVKNLFAKFSRTEEARMHDPNGMGIGLYFLKRVVEDHHGSAGASSEGLGKGSTFWVQIPIQSSPPGEKESKA